MRISNDRKTANLDAGNIQSHSSCLEVTLCIDIGVFRALDQIIALVWVRLMQQQGKYPKVDRTEAQCSSPVFSLDFCQALTDYAAEQWASLFLSVDRNQTQGEFTLSLLARRCLGRLAREIY